jgi:hypothetical protein
VVYDFSSHARAARLTVDKGGREQSMGGWDWYVGRPERMNGAVSWWSKGHLYFRDDSYQHGLGQRAIFFVPPWGDAAHGDAVASFPLEASLLRVPKRGIVDPGLGGARAVGVPGTRAPCPLDGRTHRIRFRLFARRLAASSVRFEVDHTSGDDMNHYLNLDPDTLAVAERSTNFTFNRGLCLQQRFWGHSHASHGGHDELVSSVSGISSTNVLG